MSGSGSDQRDSHDTLYVPFVWVPDGTPRPTEWLARHPEAFWVLARLVRGGASSGTTDAQTDGFDGSDNAQVAGDQGRAADPLGSVAPVGLGNRRRKPGAYWLTAAGVGLEDPVAAYLRVDEYLAGLGAGRDAKAGSGEVVELNAPAAAPNSVAGTKSSVADAQAGIEAARARAFLRLLRWLETGAVSDDVAYRTRFGGGALMTDDELRDCTPQVVHVRRSDGTISNEPYTAAGAYQITARTWDDARRKLGLHDFSPASQDLIAEWLIRNHGALDDVRGGRLDEAFRKLKKTWPSLPGDEQTHHPAGEVQEHFAHYLEQELGAADKR